MKTKIKKIVNFSYCLDCNRELQILHTCSEPEQLEKDRWCPHCQLAFKCLESGLVKVSSDIVRWNVNAKISKNDIEDMFRVLRNCGDGDFKNESWYKNTQRIINELNNSVNLEKNS